MQKRNTAVEEKYKVKIVTIEDFGTSGSAGMRIKNTVSAGDFLCDFAMMPAYDAPVLAYQSFLYDLNAIEYLDLDKDFWDRNANANFTIQDVLYYTTGDISRWDDSLQHCVAFNKNMMKENHPDVNLYDLVSEGKWTLNVMNNLAKEVSEDLNNDGRYNEFDLFGLMLWDDTVYGMINASGAKIVSLDLETGKLTLGLDNNERLLNLLTEFTVIGKNPYTFNFQRVAGGDLSKTINVFSDNRAMFFMTLIKELNMIRDMETDYGILPYPKYTEDQDRYYNSVSPWHMTFACVPFVTGDIEKTGIILRELAYYAREYITPAYNESVLTGRYIRDDESSVSLEIMSSTRIYDLGFFLRPGKLPEQIINSFRNGMTSYASLIASYKTAALNDLANMEKKFFEDKQNNG